MQIQQLIKDMKTNHSENCLLENETLVNQNENEMEHTKSPPCDPYDKTGLTETGKDQCAGKAASGSCNTTKDVCTDEGLCPENILLETIEATKKSVSGFEFSAKGTDDDISGHLMEGEALIKQDSKVTCAVAKDTGDQNSCCIFEFENKMKDDDQITKDMSDRKTRFHLGDFDRVSEQLGTVRFDFSSSDKILIYQKDTEQVNYDKSYSTAVALPIIYTDSSQSSKLVENCSHALSPDMSKDDFSTETVESQNIREPKDCSAVEKISSAEEGGNSTPDFNPGTMMTKDRVNSFDNTECEQLMHSQNYSAREEMVLDGVLSSSRCSLYHNNHGDINSIGPFYLSGPKASSSHIAFSGSISLRSDSSTTSTRSFAFPILQPEWNSSPVKMAKADQSHMRKHRCLRTRLFCCKF
ncbi:hypothetical protein Cni_G21097 [Canna indica]|uniref:Uncharacterized protein n=1 Tax=Canna indica TaxID=4628 RepID=A0AAQ3QKE2_9LILI|nr:hypothetical protein Cni_G21097 [Canna indica]